MNRVILSGLLSGILVLPLFALDLSYVTPRLGVLYLANTVPGSAAAPILSTFGASLCFSFEEGSLWSLDTGLDIYWTQYEWSPLLGRAVPTEPETLESAFVPALMLDATVGYRFELSPTFSLKPGLGTAFAVRIAFPSNAGMSEANTALINGWFYAAARFFYPEIQLLVDYKIQDQFAFQFGLRTLWPLFNLWTATDFFDQWGLGVTMAMRIALP